MSWNLTEEEQGQLMGAAEKTIRPWLRRVATTIRFEGEPMTIYPTGIGPDAPIGIRELNAVYEGIIEKGAFAGNPDHIKTEERP